MKKRFTIAILISACVAVLSRILATALMTHKNALVLVGWICVCFLIASTLVGAIIGFILNNAKKKAEGTKNQSGKLDRVRKSAGKNYLSLRRGVLASVVLGYLYCGLLMASAAVSMTASWLIDGLGFFILLFSLYIFFGMLLFLLSKPNYIVPRRIISEREYPEICGLVTSIAEKLDLSGTLAVCLLPNDSCGIQYGGNMYFLTLGAVALKLFTKEELEQVIIHELAHIKNKDLKTGDFCSRSVAKFCSLNDTALVWASMPIMLPLSVIQTKFEIFSLGASVAREARADEFIKQHGNPNKFANAIAKLTLFSVYKKELKSVPAMYESPSCPEHICRDTVEDFYDSIHKRKDIYASILKNQIARKNSSHPSFPQRMDAVGAADFDFETVEPTHTQYFRERERLVDLSDAISKSEINIGAYIENRKAYYEIPSQKISEFEKKDKEKTVADLAELMGAAKLYLELSRYEKAEALFERMIELDGRCAFAYFGRAHRKLLWHYDESGLEDMLKAIELNAEYGEEGFSAIEYFCCLMGLEKELDTYRRKIYDRLEGDASKWSGFVNIDFDDRLESHKLDPETEKNIIEKLNEYFGEALGQLYIVHKVVNELVCGEIVGVKPAYAFDSQEKSRAWAVAKDTAQTYLESISSYKIVLCDLDGNPKATRLIQNVEGSLKYKKPTE